MGGDGEERREEMERREGDGEERREGDGEEREEKEMCRRWAKREMGRRGGLG